MHVPFAQEHQELPLGELRIDPCHGDHVKGEIPRGEPRVLPLVGHRQDVAGVEVLPAVVAAMAAFPRRLGHVAVSLQPVRDDVVIELLRPKQSCVGLPRHDSLLVFNRGVDDRTDRRCRPRPFAVWNTPDVVRRQRPFALGEPELDLTALASGDL